MKHQNTKFLDQLTRVYNSFYERPKTMKEADRATGVMRENICWYCRTLRKSNQLFPVGKKICGVTKRYVFAWTTNPDLVPEDPQLKLF